MKKRTKSLYLLSFVLGFICPVFGQNQECFDCHSDEEFSTEKNNKTISLFVNPEDFNNSVHSDLECVDCHDDFDSEEIPHREGENIAAVNCENCHEFENVGIHLEKNTCYDCHSKHNIKYSSELSESNNALCSSCHKNKAVNAYYSSVHYNKDNLEDGAKCLDCHNNNLHEIKTAKFTETELHKTCAQCHEQIVNKYEKSLHGIALSQGKYLAPNCLSCHGSHNILSGKNPKSKTYKMNIPGLCGRCHKEGTKVSEIKDISQHNILENYSQSIHGDGIFKRGLIVAAVCSDCHTSHYVLPHENPESSINRNRIAQTCTACHVEIEKVHVKVISGKLWESEPQKIPACVDCHQPHTIRRVIYEQKYTDDYCMGCHIDPELEMNRNGKKISLYIDYEKFKKSAHSENSCIKCHTNISVKNEPVCIKSGKVDCSSCHAEESTDYLDSIHGKLHSEKNPDAPYCTDCHGNHNIKKRTDLYSPIARKNIPYLCGTCHKDGEKASKKESEIGEHHIISNYTMSIHGKGLLESGLLVSATCVDCHTSHNELPLKDKRSSINPDNLPKTCAKCHLGIYEKFRTSVHSKLVTKTDKRLPSCYDCHKSHTIERVDLIDFRTNIYNQCGECHTQVTESYFDTFHGKVSKLGEVGAAKCYDCHGSHNILPVSDPNSTLSRANIVATCANCHPNSNRKFTGYLTHATHHDKDKFPYLYYTYLFMTILLVSTFALFGLHTLLWLIRALLEKRKEKKRRKNR